MLSKKFLCLFLGVSLLTIFSFYCTKENPTKPSIVEEPPIGDTTSVKILIESAGELPDPETHPIKEDTSRTWEKEVEDGKWIYREIHVSAAEAPEKFPNFDPGAEVIWPGAAVQGKTIQSPIPERIIANRGSGTILINNVNGAEVSSVSFDEVTQANVMDAANKIISTQPDTFPADLYISIDRVRCEELALKLQTNAGFFSLFKSSSRFSVSKEDKVSSFLVTLNQSFYTLIFERPPEIKKFGIVN